MGARHTPGPWEVNEYGEHREIQEVDPGGISIAIMSAGSREDARLIAAAPDLLAALQDVMTWIKNWSPDFTDDVEWPADRDKALAAIAKAKGDQS